MCKFDDVSAAVADASVAVRLLDRHWPLAPQRRHPVAGGSQQRPHLDALARLAFFAVALPMGDTMSPDDVAFCCLLVSLIFFFLLFVVPCLLSCCVDDDGTKATNSSNQIPAFNVYIFGLFVLFFLYSVHDLHFTGFCPGGYSHFHVLCQMSIYACTKQITIHITRTLVGWMT